MVFADARAEIFSNPPVDAAGFLDAVIAADANTHTHRHPYAKHEPEIVIVNDWPFDERGRGSVSGLPLYPPDE